MWHIIDLNTAKSVWSYKFPEVLKDIEKSELEEDVFPEGKLKGSVMRNIQPSSSGFKNVAKGISVKTH